MPLRILEAFRSLLDPLRNARAADRWIAALPESDSDGVRKKAVEVVGRFARADVRPRRVEALLKVDARLAPLLAQLTGDYTANYDKSTEIELRMWQVVFDLIKVFVAAYGRAWRAGRARVEEQRWRPVLPEVVVRLAHYKGLDGKYRLFRFSQWTHTQWRAFHELYESAREQGWHRRPLAFGKDLPAHNGASIEQEYVKTLLLMRLDSGNFTADQVEWIASRLEDWSPALSLVPEPAASTGFVVDLSSDQGLRRRDGAYRNRNMLFVDATPVYARVVERLRDLPQQQEEEHPSGSLPLREQRLLLMRLATLFGPDAIAITPRAERVAIDSEVRVVVGLQALLSAVGEADAAHDTLQDDAAIARQVAEIGAAIAATDSLRESIAGSMWKMADRSASGCRLTAPRKDTAVKLGDLLAINEDETWALGIVRRMRRDETDRLTVGVEIVARRFGRVLLREWTGVEGSDAGRQPFFAIYVPSDSENRQAPQRSLIGPQEPLVKGALADLHTSRGHYLIRLTETRERQQGWAWALFNAVRKLD